MKKLLYLMISSALTLSHSTALVKAQPAEISIRSSNGNVLPDCINGLDGLGYLNSQIDFMISAKSLNTQEFANLGFTIYSPDYSTINDTVLWSNLLPFWKGPYYWNITDGTLFELIGSGLPDTVLTHGEASIGSGFQTDTFIDIMRIRVDINELGIICIDSAFVGPSGDWLMTPDGPPQWNGGGGDLAVGGSSQTAFCLSVVLGPEESPCVVSEDASAFGEGVYQVRIGDTLVLLDSAITTRTNYTVTSFSLGTASIDSAGYTTFVPHPLDLGYTVTLEINYSLPSNYTDCYLPTSVSCSDGASILILPPSNCCDVPGDADHGQTMNIGDVTFLIARIFSGGKAPTCINEADANGDGSFNVADVTYLINRVFGGGPAPICGTVVN